MDSRYSRQIILPQIGKQGQETLLKSKIVIIGCGALGTTISSNLARAGAGRLTIIDRDIVELNNLQRQILFDETDIGSPKVIAACDKLKKINSEIDLIPILKDLNPSNVEDIIRGSDLVVDATDNFQTRMIVNDACIKNGIPWIYAGVIQSYGMTMNILPDGPCLRCVLPALPPPGSMPTCESTGVLNSIPAIIASIQSTEAIKILLKKNPENRLIFYDVWNHQFEKIEAVKNPDCECCGKNKFKFLDREHREMILDLCENAVQIIPSNEGTIDLKKIARNVNHIASQLMVTDFLLKFKAEGKNITIFNDGRAIIKGTGDKGIAKSLYTRYIGL